MDVCLFFTIKLSLKFLINAETAAGFSLTKSVRKKSKTTTIKSHDFSLKPIDF